MSSDTAIDYRYLGRSCVDDGADGTTRLDLATSGGLGPGGSFSHPHFFSGFVEHPAVVAQGLLVLARIARTRFYVPPNTLAAVLRAADPVVTSTPEGLRLESFSVCCGVYARLDIDSAALDAEHASTGVTNVDVNPPLRQVLAGLSGHAPLHLGVGAGELRVSTLDSEVVEEKVPLPTRWLKGFAESQMLMARMTVRHELTGPAVRSFVQGLPRSSPTKSVMWATAAVRSIRLGTRPAPGAVCVAGPDRLRVLEPLVRFATALRAYSTDTDATSLPMSSGWVLDLPGGRLTIGLSPEKSRGFSGEGAVLHALSGDTVADDADLVSALLAFDPRIDIAQLAGRAGIAEQRTRAALSLLASSGQVGYDLAAGAYFHRPLPMRSDALTELHPRLAEARRLVEQGAVTHDPARSVSVIASAGTVYEAHVHDDPSGDTCTCPWYAKHRGTRGPCKHVLAARIAAGRTTP